MKEVKATYLKILQVLKLKFAKINKRGVLIRYRGMGEIEKQGDVYEAPKSSGQD